jgi:hypothetical protein
MIPVGGARTACETGINDGGYRVSGRLLETFTVLSTVLLRIPPRLPAAVKTSLSLD